MLDPVRQESRAALRWDRFTGTRKSRNKCLTCGLKSCGPFRLLGCCYFTPVSTGDVKDHLHTQLTRRGIDPRRFELLDQTDDPHYLYVYHRIDIGLDVFPWNGGTTVREALWMGVPVVGLYGDRSSACSTAAVLHQAGLPELIARSPSEYVQIVEHLSNDLNRLQDLRDSIRRRVRDTLCNAPAVTRGIERAYRQMWRKWCQSPQVTNACSLSL